MSVLVPEDRQATLQLMMEVARDRRNDDHARGLADIRVRQLLGAELALEEVAALVGQSTRSFQRRVHLAHELARPGMEDIAERVRLREIGITNALELVRLRVAGHEVTDAQLTRLRRDRGRHGMDAVEQARLEAFVEGVRWCHRALLSEQPHPDWLSQLASDWRRARGA